MITISTKTLLINYLIPAKLLANNWLELGESAEYLHFSQESSKKPAPPCAFILSYLIRIACHLHQLGPTFGQNPGAIPLFLPDTAQPSLRLYLPEGLRGGYKLRLMRQTELTLIPDFKFWF